jgi:carbamate kinase
MTTRLEKPPVAIALGGNAIIGENGKGNLEDQWRNTRHSMDTVAEFLMAYPDQPLVLTHGNGPQVGNIILRSEIAAPSIFPIPLDVAVADTEGAMGYMIQVALHNALAARGQRRAIVTLVTQVVVDPADPAFQTPTKFIGPPMTPEEAERNRQTRGWNVREYSEGRWRRVVASPRPKRIVEAETVLRLVRAGSIIIAAGGGGIPIVEDATGQISGIEAVIDKDWATAMLARQLGSETFIILTGSDGVWEHWGKLRARRLPQMGLAEARRRLAEGQFPAGSMGPKIEAAIDFLEGGGSHVYIGRHDLLMETIAGRAGTRIMK